MPHDSARAERAHLDELIRAAEAEHGPVTEEQIQALRDRLQRAREEQRSGGGAPAG